jgi:hypothetical protein
MCHLDPTELTETHVRWLKFAGRQRARGRVLKDVGLEAEWESIEAVRQTVVRKMERALVGAFQEQSRQAVDALSQILPALGVMKSDPDAEDVIRQLLDGPLGAYLVTVFWDEFVDDALASLIWDAVETGFTTGVVRISVEDIDYGISPAQRDVVRDLASKVKGASETTKADLAKLIGDAVESGKTRDQIADLVRGQFTEWESWRATTIANTTATGGFEAGQVEAYAIAGIEEMTWLSQRDGRVRESHASGSGVDGEKVRVGDTFSNGCRYPGDPLGPLEEVIACRCSTVPVIKPRKSVDPLGAFHDRERSRIEHAIRDLAIRHAYAPLRDSVGQSEAIARLAETFAASESTVKRAIWP